MNGVHDMGGMQCFGAVLPEPNEPVFHAEWERRAFALTLAMGATGQWNIDMSRAARESLPPAQYLASSYYEIWFAALQRLLLQRGLIGADELQAARMLHAPLPLARVLRASEVDAALARGAPSARASAAPARFAFGDRVRARRLQPPGHTRLPRYVRGCCGRIVAVRGTHVFPDVSALGAEQAHWLYTVEFDGRELWGDAAEADSSVSVDAWQPYLEPAHGAASARPPRRRSPSSGTERRAKGAT